MSLIAGLCPASRITGFSSGFPPLIPSSFSLLFQGFGSMSGEHWLGNEFVYLLTSQRQYAMRVELTDWDGHQAYSQYDRFHIGTEKQNYRYILLTAFGLFSLCRLSRNQQGRNRLHSILFLPFLRVQGFNICQNLVKKNERMNIFNGTSQIHGCVTA